MSGLNWKHAKPDRIVWVNRDDAREEVAHILVRDLLGKDNETVEKLFIKTFEEKKHGIQVMSTPSCKLLFAKIDESVPFGEIHLFKTLRIHFGFQDVTDVF